MYNQLSSEKVQAISGGVILKVLVGALLTDSFKEDLVKEFSDIEFLFGHSEQEEINLVGDADVYMGNITREIFLASQKISWIQCPGTGIDKIMSIPEVIDSDVVVTNSRGPHTEPMADHGIAMILTFAHRLRDLWEDQKQRKWDLPFYDEKMIELNGSTMGILGVGGIGSAVARRAAAFGIDVYGVDIDRNAGGHGVKEIWGLDRLDELLQISDWFVVSVPYTTETDNLLDINHLKYLKQGGRLIVLSRGGIVNQSDVLKLLENGPISGAGFDVTDIEPLPKNDPLWSHPEVLISPHVSALTVEMWDGRREIFKENLRRYISNRSFLYVCDKTAGY